VSPARTGIVLVASCGPEKEFRVNHMYVYMYVYLKDTDTTTHMIASVLRAWELVWN
jgi:hypothetical protein